MSSVVEAVSKPIFSMLPQQKMRRFLPFYPVVHRVMKLLLLILPAILVEFVFHIAMNRDPQDFDESLVMAHLESPYHRGRLGNAAYVHTERNHVCGDWVRLELAVGESEQIAEAYFDGRGCVISQAAASILCEYIEGQTFGQLGDFQAQDMLDLLGIPLVPRRQQCGLLAFKALKTMIYMNQ